MSARRSRLTRWLSTNLDYVLKNIKCDTVTIKIVNTSLHFPAGLQAPGA
jgi:hypothetical protein